MSYFRKSRREFLKLAAVTSGALVLPGSSAGAILTSPNIDTEDPADYELTIKVAPVEIAAGKILSLVTYNGQFPGPLLRFQDGKEVTIDVFNDTDTPEQLHWHGQKVPSEVDGAAEEGTPFIPPHGKQRIQFVPGPSGFRFYHTHVRAGADLYAGQYSGQVGPVYVDPKHEPGLYDREVFLTLKEFEPTFSRGGDMAMNFLSPATKIKELQQQGESAMKASLAKGMPKGYEVGYGSFTINGRMLGHGEPIRVKQGERVLLHVLNGSATEIRSLALPGHVFEVVALDGNPVPNPTKVPVLWLGTAERISAIVTMNHPGVWIMGDTADDDRKHGMGIVVEYAGSKGKGQWVAPPRSHWNYSKFSKPGTKAEEPQLTFEMLFAKDNAAEVGFNRWSINGNAYPMNSKPQPATLHLKQGYRYRLRMRNASDDIHPIHLHRHYVRVGECCGTARGWSHERCRDAGWISASRNRFRGRQSRAHAVSLSSATAYGFWIHDLVRLSRMTVSDITIRTAAQDDAAAIIPLVNAAFVVEDFLEGTRTDAERLAKSMATGEFLVAESAIGKLVAAVYVEVNGERGYFGMLAVDPAQQGRGLGRRMIDAAENYFRAAGCQWVDIKVLSLRQGLPEYYRKFGYVETGSEEFHPSRPLKPGVECHCIAMAKRLN